MAGDSQVLHFTVEGRRGDEYRIDAWRQGEDLLLTCTCPAGVNRRHCHHRVALLNGVVDDLLSDNEEDVARLRELLRGSRMEPVLKRFCAIEREFGPDNWAYEQAKEELTEFLALGFALGGAPGSRQRKIRRTERLGAGFDTSGCPKGWAFAVTGAFRTALDIQYSTLVDRERSKKARALKAGAAPVYRKAWTRGVPPTLSFERGHVLYERGGADGREGRDWLRGVKRVAQVRAAQPDAVGRSDGWVEFELWTIVAGELGEGLRHRCSQAAFCEFLRTGVLPEQRAGLGDGEVAAGQDRQGDGVAESA